MVDRIFDRVFIRPPSKVFPKCVSRNPFRVNVNVDNARRQHKEYVKTLLDYGVEIIELDTLEGFPDSVFIQDTAVVGAKSNRALIARFGENSRRGEEEDVAQNLLDRGYEIMKIHPPGTLEGGDVMVTDLGIIYVGLSERTNMEGIEQISKCFQNVSVVYVPLERTFHLLGGVNYLGNKTIIISPNLVDLKYFEEFKMIIVPKGEEYSSNVLYLGDGNVLIPSGFPKTYEKLKVEGFNPIKVDVSEFWKCDGGVTCLNLPIYKTV
ncbi:MAG: arginine deiminase family protein [Candidatus Methanomethylicia archaeon]